MSKRAVDMDAPFLTINAAARKTGLSSYFLRAGCRDGSIPCIHIGSEYRVDVPALLDMLHAEAKQHVEG